MKLILGTTIFILLSLSFMAFAQGGGMTTYFGGKVLFTVSCTCDSGRTMVVIDDYASGSTIKLGYNSSQLSTLFYDHRSPYINHYLVGSYGSSSQSCRIRILYYCLSITLDGDFNSDPGTGTS